MTQKIEETRAELKQDGHIELAPAMITLPEFEEERMALMAEEHDILVDLVDHMHALSERVDQLEQTYRALALSKRNPNWPRHLKRLRKTHLQPRPRG